MLALRHECSTLAFPTPQKDLLNLKLVELKMLLDFSDCTRTGTSMLTTAADKIARVTQTFILLSRRVGAKLHYSSVPQIRQIRNKNINMSGSCSIYEIFSSHCFSSKWLTTVDSDDRNSF